MWMRMLCLDNHMKKNAEENVMKIDNKIVKTSCGNIQIEAQIETLTVQGNQWCR